MSTDSLEPVSVSESVACAPAIEESAQLPLEESIGCGLYVVTAAQPSIVTHARVARFISPDQPSVLLVRLNRIEVYEVSTDSTKSHDSALVAYANLPVFGRIAALEVLPGVGLCERATARGTRVASPVGALQPSERLSSLNLHGGTPRSGSKRARTSSRHKVEAPLKPVPETARTVHVLPSESGDQSTDAVFILTERLDFAVIKYDTRLQGVVTLVAGSLASKLGRRCPLGEFVALDPSARCLAVYAYDGLLKVVPGSLMGEAFEVRLDVVQVQSMEFLIGTEHPTLAIIHTDYLHNRHLVSYEILLGRQDVREGPIAQQYLDASAELIIPVPPAPNDSANDGACGGFVVACDTSLALHPGRSGVAKQVIHFHGGQFAPMRCFCPISGIGSSSKSASVEANRQDHFETGLEMLAAAGYHAHYLLGDRDGFLYVLSVGAEVGMRLECVCESSVASAIAYLGSDLVFVGSALGDSQLVRLLPSQTESPELVQTTLFATASASSHERRESRAERAECQLWFGQVVQCYTNIGPIQDLLVTGDDSFSDGHIITCSGVSRMGSLRIIRNGIGFVEHAAVELDGIKALFTLPSLTSPEWDEFLVVSFTAETRVLRLAAHDELVEVESLAVDEATILAMRLPAEQLALWVTASYVGLVDLTLLERPAVAWTPPSSEQITNAVFDELHKLVLVSTSNAQLYVLQQRKTSLVPVGSQTLPAEVACIHAAYGIVALGTWAESRIRLFRLHEDTGNRWELECIRESALPSTSVPRSVLLTYLDDHGGLMADHGGRAHLCLLVAVGDGRLFAFNVSQPDAKRSGPEPEDLSKCELQLQHPRQLRLGSRPAALNNLQLHGMRYVFAACGRASVIHAHHGTLFCGNVNLRDVTRAVRFHTKGFPDSIAVATEQGLALGGIEHIQQLHIRRHDLREQPRRIAHLRGYICLLTVSIVFGEERHHVRLLNDETLETITSHDLAMNEHGLSLVAIPERDVFVVGTAYVLPSEMEPSRGRILVFSREELLLLNELNTPGAVYTMSALADPSDRTCRFPASAARFLAAGVNNVVILYDWGQSGHGDDYELREVARHLGHVLVLRLEARGDQLLVGDLMKSLCVLQLVLPEGETSDGALPCLKAVAWDYETAWITACAFLNEDTYLAADNSYNLLSLQRNPHETRSEFRHALNRAGAFHLGDLVNVFRRGKLVTEASGNEEAGTGNGHSTIDTESTRDVARASTGTTTADNVSRQTLLFATTAGAIGIIVPLDPAQHRMLSRVEKALRSLTDHPAEAGAADNGHERVRRSPLTSIRLGVEGFAHADWRTPLSERALNSLHSMTCFDLPRRGFVDGDLVERFRELEPTEMEFVAAQVGASIEHIKLLVDDLARLH